MKLLALYTTVATREDAQRLARTMVERRLAACAQIDQIESFYPWNGAIQNEPEYRILFKTTDVMLGALEAALLEIHPYELPALHAVAAEHVHPAYAEWVEAGTRPAT